jgi:hypothetical protein
VQGPVQRRFGLATVHVDVAGRRSRAEFRDRTVEEADRLVEELSEFSRQARRPPGRAAGRPGGGTDGRPGGGDPGGLVPGPLGPARAALLAARAAGPSTSATAGATAVDPP